MNENRDSIPIYTIKTGEKLANLKDHINLKVSSSLDYKYSHTYCINSVHLHMRDTLYIVRLC